MMMAKELGLSDIYEEAKAKLKAVLIDWYTWTPGETKKFFSYIPRWGGLVGENTSYDSDTFNDHHFHYGYFTYASALLCFEDADFKTRFGGMAKLLAKDYANWDRGETRFPLFRTLDPWGGHSFAGGVGDGNGNGQESSSEAMQGWAGLFPLGLRITAPRAVLKEGVATELMAEGWFGGTKMGPVPVSWSSHGGKIDQNGKFTPAQGGLVTVRAVTVPEGRLGDAAAEAARGTVGTEAVFPVEEALKVQSFALSPREVELAVGDEVKFRPEARDQFGGNMPIKGVKGKKPKLGTMKKGGVFVAEKKGRTTFEMTLGDQTAVANITVKDLSEIDLARKATVTASGCENDGLKPEHAIDGDPKTRWGAAHKDGEWIQLDLGKVYKVTTVELVWENARAIDYDILVSADGANWTLAVDARDTKGGAEIHDIRPTSARYVKILGLKRNTSYGISLFRLSVFAKK